MATYVTNRDSGGLTDEKGHLKFLANSYSGNILDGMQVVENSPTGMSVRVAAGNIRIPYLNYAYMGWSEGYTGVSVSTADVSNPRIDRVVAYVDRSMTFTDSDTNNPNALKFMAVTGTPNAVPSKPSDAAVNTAVGAANPWVEIGLVRVNAGATTILTANITDTRVFISPTYNYDWRKISANVTSVTPYGQRSYDIAVDTDLREILPVGSKLRTERATPAPTQCITFNGSTQYATKTSPTNVTMTDDITVIGWVNPAAYQQGIFAARQNGNTDGFYAYMLSSGQIRIGGARGGDDFATSSEGLRTNEWQHFAMTIDSSAGVATMYINGNPIPFAYNNSANTAFAAPTGTLSVGAASDGTSKFAGKMAQLGIFNTVLTASQIRNYMNQGLTGSEANLVAGYSFNGNMNDLTANGNNLTAVGSVTATTADSPFGNQSGGAVSAVYDYHIVQRVTASTITVSTAEGCTVPTTGNIASLYYSGQRLPMGFPGQRKKWQLHVIYTNSVAIGSPASGAWYNIASLGIDIPYGEWSFNAKIPAVCEFGSASTSAFLTMNCTFSLSNTTPTLTQFGNRAYVNDATGFGVTFNYANIPISATNTTPTRYYYLIMHDNSSSTLYINQLYSSTTIILDNAYL